MRRSFVVVGLYSLITFVYTYPLIFKLGGSIYGFAGDNLGAMHYLWWWKYTFLNHLDLRNSFLEQAPFGFKIDSETGSVLYYWPLKILTLIFNEVVSYNLILWLSFPLAALAMYFLTKRFLKIFTAGQRESRLSVELISFWAGLVFSFSPYHFWKSYNHLDLALIWTFPLAVLFLLQSLENPSSVFLKNKKIFLSALFMAITILSNFYSGFFLLLCALLLTIFYGLVEKGRVKNILLILFLNFLVTFLLVIPFIGPTVYDAYIKKGVGQSAARVANYNRPLLDVVSLSARPWDYVIPSQDNPLFGSFSKRFYQWVVTQGRDFKVVSGPVHERTIFLGFVSIFLLLFNAILLIRSADFRRQYGRISIILWLVFVSLFLLSMPPYIFVKGRFTVYLPSFLLFKVLPVFRTYSRLGIFVLLFAILLSSTVLSYLGRNYSKKRLVTLFLLLVALSSLEFANIPPSKVTELRQPRALEYLGSKKEDLNFVVYPKEFNVAELLVFQPKFQKGFLNFHSQSEYYKLWDFLADFRNPKTYALLSSLGIKYVVFQKKLIFNVPNPVDDLWYTRALNSSLGTLPPGLDLEKDYEDSSVYKVTAEPVGFIVAAKNRVDAFSKDPFTVGGSRLRVYFANLDSESSASLNLNLTIANIGNNTNLEASGENISWRIVDRRDEDVSLFIVLEKEEGFLDISIPNAKSVEIKSLGANGLSRGPLTQDSKSAIIN